MPAAPTSTTASVTPVSSTALSNHLPTSVPRLDPSGLNWAIFSVRFQDAIEAKGFWGHFTGKKPIPVPADAANPTVEETEAITLWEKNECSPKSLLTQKLPDSALMQVQSKKTVRERWEAIEAEFTEMGTFAQTEMRAKFMESKCPDKGNAKEFLDALWTKREELAAMGIDIDEKDYRSTIISSLPIPLANFASNQLAATRGYSSSKTIAPDLLILWISEEYNRQKLQ
jgi:hypothetical protein